MNVETLVTDAGKRALLEGPLKEVRDVWALFLMLTETPRVSHKLDAIRARLLAVGKAAGLETDTDAAGNVVMRRAASAGKEQAPMVCMQSHMDMVTSANEGTVFDFDTQPIELTVEDGWLKAVGTTLGADNGVGLAASLAVLLDDSLAMGPLEAVFTADEETTMGGAENMAKAPFLKSQVMINVDSEEEEAICVGCAGGYELTFDVPVERETSGATAVDVKVSLSGFVGGHTGIDIDRGHGSALVELLRMLDVVRRRGVLSQPLQLVSFAGGGAINTIPRDAGAVVRVGSSGDVAALEATVQTSLVELQRLYAPIESSVVAEVETVGPSSGTALSVASTGALLDLWLQVPSGPVRHISAARHEVETSISFSRAHCEREGTPRAHVFVRTSSDPAGDLLLGQLQALGRLVPGCVVSAPFHAFPSWCPDYQSAALKSATEAVQKEFGRAPRVYSVHAGLECGFVMGHYPAMDVVSIGPDIRGAHSPDERCNIASVTRFYRILLDTIHRIQSV